MCPSWQFHRKRMALQGDDAQQLLTLLDSGIPEIHMIYRRKTHKKEMAPILALLTAMLSKNPSTDVYPLAFNDALRHIEDDALYNRMFYGTKRKTDAE